MIPLSICMPAYKSASTIKGCIQSILSQGFSHFELIIVDDGSTDDTDALERAFNDPHIRFVSYYHDYIGSLNLSLSLAEGKYIVRMDADDLMLPHRLAFQFYAKGYMDGSIACMLDKVDRMVATVLTEQCQDNTLATGLRGLIAYATARRLYENGFPVSENFPDLKSAAYETIYTTNQLTECYYAFLYLGRKDGKACKPCIEISEWCNAPMYVPRNLSRWNTSLANGCLDAMVEAIGMDNIRKEVNGTE